MEKPREISAAASAASFRDVRANGRGRPSYLGSQAIELVPREAARDPIRCQSNLMRSRPYPKFAEVLHRRVLLVGRVDGTSDSDHERHPNFARCTESSPTVTDDGLRKTDDALPASSLRANFPAMHGWQVWLVAALLLFVAEMLAPGFWLLSVAAGCLPAGVVCLSFRGAIRPEPSFPSGTLSTRM